MSTTLAETGLSDAAAAGSILVQDPGGILAILLLVLALIFWLTQQKWAKPVFKIIPALVLCYFVPTALTTAGVLPNESPLYDWIKANVLPAALFLLILSLDLPAILRLGPKAGIMLLAGTAGVVVGGPIALALGGLLLRGPYWGLPPDAWQGLAALSGSWIGGGANFVAIGQMVGASDDMIATMVVPDVFIASIWMGVLLYLSGHQHRIDKWTGADASAIRNLERRLADFQQRVMRVPTLADLMIIVALGFGASWLGNAFASALKSDAENTVRVVASEAGVSSVVVHHIAEGTTQPTEALVPLAEAKPYQIGRELDELAEREPGALAGLSGARRGHYRWSRFVNETTGRAVWLYVFVTTVGVLLSFTKMRRLEGAGASRVGSLMLYLLVACIGAHANFHDIAKAPGFIVVGAIWMLVHVTVLLAVGWMIRAPIFFVAVGSQANIGGAASAPIVAAAYHPAPGTGGGAAGRRGVRAGHVCRRGVCRVAQVGGRRGVVPARGRGMCERGQRRGS